MDPPTDSRGRGSGNRGGRGRGSSLSKRFNPYQNRSLWNSNRNPPGPRVKSSSIPLTNSAASSSSSLSDSPSSSICPPLQDQPLVSFMLDDNNSQEVAGWKLYFPQDSKNYFKMLLIHPLNNNIFYRISRRFTVGQ